MSAIHDVLRRMGLTVALLAGPLWGAGTGAAQTAETVEQPVVLDATSFVPEELLSGPHFSVDTAVMNDGFLNHFTIRSDYGDMVAISNAMLRIRVHEINAITVMDQLRDSDEFKQSAVEGAQNTLKSAKALVTDPVNTVSGAVSGVSKLFNRAGETLTGTRSDSEDSRAESLIGFSKTKRDYASQFGVDPYSSNKPLQEALDEISWSGYLGGLTVSAALSMVPGAAGAVVTAVGSSELMNDVMRDKAPADLRILNRGKLVQMGIDPHFADAFVEHPIYTPTQQTLLVAALEQLSPAANRQVFVARAILATDDDTAFFNQRYAQMMAGYHRGVEPVRELVRMGPVVAIRTQSNKLVLTLPIDYMVWTSSTAAVADQVSQIAAVESAGGGQEIWLTGSLTELASAQLSRLKWSVVAQTEDTLIGR